MPVCVCVYSNTIAVIYTPLWQWRTGGAVRLYMHISNIDFVIRNNVMFVFLNRLCRIAGASIVKVLKSARYRHHIFSISIPATS